MEANKIKKILTPNMKKLAWHHQRSLQAAYNFSYRMGKVDWNALDYPVRNPYPGTRLIGEYGVIRMQRVPNSGIYLSRRSGADTPPLDYSIPGHAMTFDIVETEIEALVLISAIEEHPEWFDQTPHLESLRTLLVQRRHQLHRRGYSYTPLVNETIQGMIERGLLSAPVSLDNVKARVSEEQQATLDLLASIRI